MGNSSSRSYDLIDNQSNEDIGQKSYQKLKDIQGSSPNEVLTLIEDEIQKFILTWKNIKGHCNDEDLMLNVHEFLHSAEGELKILRTGVRSFLPNDFVVIGRDGREEPPENDTTIKKIDSQKDQENIDQKQKTESPAKLKEDEPKTVDKSGNRKKRKDPAIKTKTTKKNESEKKEFEGQLASLQREITDLKLSNMELSQENEQLLNRLSKLAGQRLTEDNPSVTDLSDPNRPMKLGEVYSEIYDNEWTDAFEALIKAGYAEEECIETLRLTLLNVLQFCQKKSTHLLTKTKEAVDILFDEYKATKELDEASPGELVEGANFQLQNKWKPKDGWEKSVRKEMPSMIEVKTPESVTAKLKVFRKEVAESMVPLLQRAYVTASWSEDCVPELKPFIKKCLFLGWMMVVHSPPLTLVMCQPGEKFNKDLYREYTISGAAVEYVVWPALLLHEKGPLIGKGVAQGKKT